jgi:hypothetical protein
MVGPDNIGVLLDVFAFPVHMRLVDPFWKALDVVQYIQGLKGGRSSVTASACCTLRAHVACQATLSLTAGIDGV